MTTSVKGETQREQFGVNQDPVSTSLVKRLIRLPLIGELLIILTFCAFTTVLTWPYVNYLRDVVVDTGDPYLITWIMWWDYHATFTDPLHLFHTNSFYPLKYTLAFSEHSYGIAVLFFPLYALGMPPLTVHAIAMFLGFAVSGYAAFRLTRTLTGSTSLAWVSGIIFAFIPYRFNMMSQVAYLFSPWLPLIFEALILFVRKRTTGRAAWLGFAFFMSGISTISWWTFSLIPLAVYSAILLTRYDAWRDRDLWKRGGISLFIASLALLPFMIPYVIANKLYGFKRTIDEIKYYSAWPTHWLAVENRNKLWNRMGEGLFEGWKIKLFPGLLPIMLSLFGVFPVDSTRSESPHRTTPPSWLTWLDVLIVLLLALSVLAIGFDHSDAFHNFFDNFTSERTLAVLTIAVAVRVCVAYPSFARSAHPNLIETFRSQNRSDAFWLGVVLTIFGFCFSLGWNFFFFRICYQLLPMFQSMRVVSRGALLAYLGLAILSALGVRNLVRRVRRRFPSVKEGLVCVVVSGLLLFELNAAPLKIERGDPFPDAVTLRLKQTNMRGGIVELPAGGPFNYRYMLRSADHQKPMIVGTSGFNSWIENKIEALTFSGTISDKLMDLMESVPTSYLVIAIQSIPPERTTDYQEFLARQVSSGRLRFINRFDGKDDLYAVVKNEPEVATEAALPISLEVRDWATEIHEDPVIMLGTPLNSAQRLYRMQVAVTGALPRYKEFKDDLEKICSGIIVGGNAGDQQFQNNFREFVNSWTRSDAYRHSLGQLEGSQFVDQLIKNSGAVIDTETRQQLVSGLANGSQTPAAIILKVTDDPRFVEKEKYRSLLTLHYFGYLRRNPDDPPDGNLNGFNFWLADLERNHDTEKLSTAFKLTGEYHQFEKKPVEQQR
jgi:hypothetical protein